MMTQVGAFAAKNRLGELLRRAESAPKGVTLGGISLKDLIAQGRR
jgi:hypothetical protein